MKKRIVCLLTAIVMIVTLTASLSITAFAHSEDDPRIILQDGQGNEETIWFQGLYTLPECEFTAPEGQRFKCWLVDGRKQMQPGEQTYTDLRTVITAVWEPLPVVSFEPNGGAEAMDNVPTEGEYPLPQCGFTAPEGKQFKCWLVNDGEKLPGDMIAVEADITVTAVWEDVPIEPTEAPTQASAEEPTEALKSDKGDNDSAFDPTVLIIVVVAVLAVGAAVVVTVLIMKKKKS